MIYVSELTGKQYKTEKECLKAEEKFKKAQEEKRVKEEKLKKERANRAKEIEDARAKMIEAEKHYKELVRAFANDYDNYHISITTKNINDMFDEVFKFL